MAIVDLRGREHEPEVRELIDSEAGWMIVGWSRDDVLVACAGLERVSNSELAVRAINARKNSDAHALLDAIATVATGSLLVAEAPERLSELYRHCGFLVEKAGPNRVRCVRSLEEPCADPRAIGAAPCMRRRPRSALRGVARRPMIRTNGPRRTRHAASARSLRRSSGSCSAATFSSRAFSATVGASSATRGTDFPPG